MKTLPARRSLCLVLVLAGCSPGPEPLPQPTVADYEEVATAIVRDLLLESRALGCQEVGHSYIDMDTGKWGGIRVWVGCGQRDFWSYRAGLGRLNLDATRRQGWRIRNEVVTGFTPDGVGAMPALFGTNATWGPVMLGPKVREHTAAASTLEPALEARARAVLARHRVAFSRRFALIGPSDSDGEDTVPTGTRESPDEFLARTGARRRSSRPRADPSRRGERHPRHPVELRRALGVPQVVRVL